MAEGRHGWDTGATDARRISIEIHGQHCDAYPPEDIFVDLTQHSSAVILNRPFATRSDCVQERVEGT
jgi:hypothetical protein